MRFIARILGNALALYVATRVVSGFEIFGGIKELLVAGLVLGLLNHFLKPVLKFFSFPFIVLTLGLFLIVINAIILWIVDWVFDFVVIASLIDLVKITVIVAVINFFVARLIKKEKDEN